MCVGDFESLSRFDSLKLSLGCRKTRLTAAALLAAYEPRTQWLGTDAYGEADSAINQSHLF